jgi:hypothetical protein
VIEAKEHRAEFTEVTETIQTQQTFTLTTMAPPKQAEASQTARQPRVRTRSWVQLEEGEQQPLGDRQCRRNPITRYDTGEPHTHGGRNPTANTRGHEHRYARQRHRSNRTRMQKP